MRRGTRDPRITVMVTRRRSLVEADNKEEENAKPNKAA